MASAHLPLETALPMCHPWRENFLSLGLLNSWWVMELSEKGGYHWMLVRSYPSYQMPMFSLLPKLICFSFWLLLTLLGQPDCLVPFSAESGPGRSLELQLDTLSPSQAVTCDTCSSCMICAPGHMHPFVAALKQSQTLVFEGHVQLWGVFGIILHFCQFPGQRTCFWLIFCIPIQKAAVGAVKASSPHLFLLTHGYLQPP